MARNAHRRAAQEVCYPLYPQHALRSRMLASWPRQRRVTGPWCRERLPVQLKCEEPRGFGRSGDWRARACAALSRRMRLVAASRARCRFRFRVRARFACARGSSLYALSIETLLNVGDSIHDSRDSRVSHVGARPDARRLALARAVTGTPLSRGAGHPRRHQATRSTLSDAPFWTSWHMH